MELCVNARQTHTRTHNIFFSFSLAHLYAISHLRLPHFSLQLFFRFALLCYAFFGSNYTL